MAASRPALRGSMDQSRVFYTSEWTKEVDRAFQRGLVLATVAGFPCNKGPNPNGLMVAMRWTNNQHKTNFTYQTCIDRYRKLRKRYNTFTWIKGLPSVTYNGVDKTVSCTEEYWDYICREDPLGRAYMNQGEEDYISLELIFEEWEPDSWAEDPDLADLSGNLGDVAEHMLPMPSTEPRDEGEHTANCFANEIAWYPTDMDSVSCGRGRSSETRFSTNAVDSVAYVHRPRTYNTHPPEEPSGSGPSSQASCSPYKKK